MQKYDLAVFIGRLQPMHLAHEAQIQRAFDLANRVLILIGSAGDAPTFKNPFSYNARAALVRARFPRAEVLPLYDCPYDDAAWFKQVHDAVTAFSPPHATTILMGHDKDHTSWYLKELAKHYTYLPSPPHPTLNATYVRELSYRIQEVAIETVSWGVKDFIKTWMGTEQFQNMRDEYRANRDYSKSFEDLPYPPVFVTVDAFVRQHNHVLLVKRKHAPGKGLWALPGGFLEPNETIVQGLAREAKEETGVDLGIPSFIAVFDNPGRSLRGRTITHVGRFMQFGNGFWNTIKAGDDAEEARPVHLHVIEARMRNKMFEDHWHIIQEMTK